MTAATTSRRQLSGRPAETVDALVAAVAPEVAETGFDGLTVRNVARRAGVSTATAYTYFASKEHLVIEVFWRRLSALSEPEFDPKREPSERIGEVSASLASLVANEPSLAAAFSTALLAHDADVKIIRDRIGLNIARRIAHCLGPSTDPDLVQILVMAFNGSLLAAGMGNIPYDSIGPMMARTVTAMGLKKSRRSPR